MFKPEKLEEPLIVAAKEARQNAYAPYSKFKVGAAVLVEIDGEEKIISGSNVENTSYGLTICAERAAIFSAISQGAEDIKAIALVADSQDPVSPCGACRQVLSEFAKGSTPVIMTNLENIIFIDSLEKLLPRAFDKITTIDNKGL